MAAILGSGEHRYRVVDNWAKLPDGWQLTDVASVAVDSKDRIYVFNRGAHPMVVFDRYGNFLRSWGEGLFSRAHGLHIDADDNLYCTDDGDHTVRKCTTDGKVLLMIGVPAKPAPFMSGDPFHRCTHTALSPKGEIYVSDGYGNARVHKFTPDGKLIQSWGEPGTDPGQFNIVHNIVADADGWVYVADRDRVQVFDGDLIGDATPVYARVRATDHAMGARGSARRRAAAARCDPLAMRRRRETVEHPFGTMKARMGATHVLTKTLPR